MKVQISNRGFYAEVICSCRQLQTENSQVIIRYEADACWENVCRAGIDIFFDYYRRQSSVGIEVYIQDIRWRPVDTNFLIVMYTTVQALSEALNFPIEGLYFDQTYERFVFPERRSVRFI